MYYKDLEEKELAEMTRKELEKWVETLYKKARQVQHSEMRHKHDAVFWKRKTSELISESKMQSFCNEVDKSRDSIL
jgi:ribosome recycling factor